MTPNGALVPLGVVTVMVYTLVALLAGSVAASVQLQRSWVAPIWKLPAWKPSEAAGTAIPFCNNWIAVMSLAPVRLAPCRVTPWFRPILKGEVTAVIEGGGGSTLKATALVVPPGVVTVILTVPRVPVEGMTNVAVICVELTTTRFVTVKPPPTLMDVAPVRFVPSA